MKSLVVLVALSLTLSTFLKNGEGQVINNLLNNFYPSNNPLYCTYNDPQDGAALRGQNFIESYGQAGNCLTLTMPQGSSRPVPGFGFGGSNQSPSSTITIDRCTFK